MSYKIQWHIQNRVIFIHFKGPITVDEAAAASQEGEHYLNEGVAPVHLIVLFENIARLPLDLRKASSMTAYLNNPKTGWVVQVGGNALLSFVISVASQLAKLHLTKRGSIEEALEFLMNQDATLQEASAP